MRIQYIYNSTFLMYLNIQKSILASCLLVLMVSGCAVEPNGRRQDDGGNYLQVVRYGVIVAEIEMPTNQECRYGLIQAGGADLICASSRSNQLLPQTSTIQKIGTSTFINARYFNREYCDEHSRKITPEGFKVTCN